MIEVIEKPVSVFNWKATAVGIILGWVILSLLFRSLFCFYTFQFPSASVITIIFGALSGLLGSVLRSVEIKFLKLLAYLLMGLMLTLALIMIIAPFVTQLNQNFCVSDLPILVSLIEEEGNAVINKDMRAIHAIYDPSAVVARANTSEFWQAYSFYSQKFAHEEHCSVSHSDYLVEEFSKEQVRLTTSSRGTYGDAGKGCTYAYANPPGSDEWTFQKIDGKWKIVYFEFNKKK